MNKYDMHERTVTISFSEYASLVYDSAKLQALESWGVNNWDGYGICMQDFCKGTTRTTCEYDVIALAILNGEWASGAARDVALEWLHKRCNPVPDKTGEWCAVMRDLERQLEDIYQANHKEDE